jgi:prevent-host-death family protein
MLKTEEKIITSDDLAGAVGQVIHRAQQEPVIVLDKGRPAAYLVSAEWFDNLMSYLESLEHHEIVKNVVQAENQFTKRQHKTLDEARTLAETAWQTA